MVEAGKVRGSGMTVDPEKRCFETNAPAGVVQAVRDLRELLVEGGLDLEAAQEGEGDPCWEIRELLDEIETLASREIRWLSQLAKEGCRPTTMWTEFIHQLSEGSE